MTKITIDNTMAQAKPRLVVSYRGSVVWAFLLEECQTWTVSSKLRAWAHGRRIIALLI